MSISLRAKIPTLLYTSVSASKGPKDKCDISCFKILDHGIKNCDRPARLSVPANVYSELCLERLLLFRLIYIARFVSSL